jgi:long-chain fatty acid transport protein
MLRRIVFLSLMVLAWPRLAAAQGGIEVDEQSARGVGTAGAQTAVANDAAAVFYNPAGMVFQPGLNVLAGGQIIYADTHAESTERTQASHTYLLPVLFANLRLGRYIAFGVGLFSNMGEHFGWPTPWPGRFIGQFVDISTATFNLAMAVRILPGVALGAGLDVVAAWVDLYRALNFGGAEGSVHVTANAVGVGGNVGLLIELVPRRLRFGFHYRSRIDLDLDGHGAIFGPPELRSLTGGRLNANATLPLPHNFAVGVAIDPARILTLSLDAKVTLWRDIPNVTINLTDPQAPPGTAPATQSIPLELHNGWGLRVGAELRVLDERLHLRVGAGFVDTPLPERHLGPLLPDTDRLLVSFGIGWHMPWLALDAGYMFVHLFKKTSTDPDFPAAYETNAHVIGLSASFRYERAQHYVRVEQPPEEPGEAPTPPPPPRKPLP